MSLQLDLTNVTLNADAVAATVAWNNELIHSALLGYAKVDFLKLKVQFGRWNPRRVDPAEVKRMADSMRTGRGLIRYTTATMVPLVMQKDQVDLDNLYRSSDPPSGADILPALILTDSAKPIFAAGGQHRRAALEALFADLHKQITALTKKAKGIKDEAQRHAQESEIEELTKELAGLGFWGVAIYDYGKFSLL